MKASLSKQEKITGEHSELMVLPCGKILAHNITPAMAEILSELNPADEPMRRRANPKTISKHELSD